MWRLVSQQLYEPHAPPPAEQIIPKYEKPTSLVLFPNSGVFYTSVEGATATSEKRLPNIQIYWQLLEIVLVTSRVR